MSQIPPNPYGNPPPQPPYGRPPPQQQPPSYGQPYPPQPPAGYPLQQGFVPPGFQPPPFAGPQKTSAAAIASLVTGILGVCPLPLIGSLPAIILGIVGLRSTGQPNVKGRGLAIAGLILGVLSLLAWGGGAVRFGGLYAAGAPDRAVARQFLADLSAGNTDAAVAACVPGTSVDAVQKTVDRVQPLGGLKDSTLFGMEFDQNGTTKGVVAGSATFGSRAASVSFELVPNPAGGKPLIEKYQVQ